MPAAGQALGLAMPSLRVGGSRLGQAMLPPSKSSYSPYRYLWTGERCGAVRCGGASVTRACRKPIIDEPCEAPWCLAISASAFAARGGPRQHSSRA